MFLDVAGVEIRSAVVPDPYVVHAHVYSDDGRIVDGAVAAVADRVIEFDALPWAAAADAYRPVVDPSGAAVLRPAVRFVLGALKITPRHHAGA